MEGLLKFNEAVSGVVWGPFTLAVFLLLGIYLSMRLDFFQLKRCGLWLRVTVGSLAGGKARRRGSDDKALSRFQTLTTSLAATIGTGSVVGVATAIFYGGPGAVFWMWASAFLGMAISFTEKTLGVMYRHKNFKGEWVGGAMVYMERGLHSKGMGLLFSFCCVLASFGMGNMAQTNSISTALHSAMGWDPFVVGILTAALLAMVVIGGLKRIAAVSEKLLPLITGLFLAGGAAVIITHGQNLLPALSDILRCAFCPRAAGGGAAGYTVAQAMRYGIARGVFSNEAGLGSSVMIHSSSEVKEPVEQGMWSILEIFVDTMVVCTVTALAILTSGVYSPEAALSQLAGQAAEAGAAADGIMAGAPITVAAFSTVFGAAGGAFVAGSVALFAFASLICWEYYGERGLEYLTGGPRLTPVYKGLFVAAAAVGSVADLGAVWAISDTFNGLMMLPNLLAIFLLSPKVFDAARRYLARLRR